MEEPLKFCPSCCHGDCEHGSSITYREYYGAGLQVDWQCGIKGKKCEKCQDE